MGILINPPGGGAIALPPSLEQVLVVGDDYSYANSSTSPFYSAHATVLTGDNTFALIQPAGGLGDYNKVTGVDFGAVSDGTTPEENENDFFLDLQAKYAQAGNPYVGVVGFEDKTKTKSFEYTIDSFANPAVISGLDNRTWNTNGKIYNVYGVEPTQGEEWTLTFFQKHDATGVSGIDVQSATVLHTLGNPNSYQNNGAIYTNNFIYQSALWAQMLLQSNNITGASMQTALAVNSTFQALYLPPGLYSFHMHAQFGKHLTAGTHFTAGFDLVLSPYSGFGGNLEFHRAAAYSTGEVDEEPNYVNITVPNLKLEHGTYIAAKGYIDADTTGSPYLRDVEVEIVVTKLLLT